MDRRLKERMIGAVVLVAAAIILIPEMLSGPHAPSDTTKQNSQATPTGPDGQKLKTYTIDLAKSNEPGKANEPAKITESVKPVAAKEQAPPAEEKSPSESSRSVITPSETSVKKVELSSGAPTIKESPKQPEVASKPEPIAPKPSASKPAQVANVENGWTVQVGSFGVRATSDRIANDLKHAGFPAFVVAFQSGNQTMYRVRVGPARDRAAAENLLNKLKGEHPNATLVPPP
ncbi:MAG TPA: SPOR domain-containing protein [Steroidobacteraceae bacterium]|nr:SPOR domain-containing protein [Steroidobacteraceae bacterium]